MTVKTILYVEDNDDNAYMLSRRLTRRGFEVVVAKDGQEGIDAALASPPDLILMDLNLPKIDGWEVTRRLKKMPTTQAIPVLAVSSHAMKGDREQALAAGCDDYDTKPIEFSRLLDKIHTLLDDESAEP